MCLRFSLFTCYQSVTCSLFCITASHRPSTKYSTVHTIMGLISHKMQIVIKMKDHCRRFSTCELASNCNHWKVCEAFCTNVFQWVHCDCVWYLCLCMFITEVCNIHYSFKCYGCSTPQSRYYVLKINASPWCAWSLYLSFHSVYSIYTHYYCYYYYYPAQFYKIAVSLSDSHSHAALQFATRPKTRWWWGNAMWGVPWS